MTPAVGYTAMKDSGIPWIGEIPKSWDIVRGKNTITLLERPVNSSDDVITCFRDGEVTLRKNRREEGFTNSLKEIGYQGVNPGDLVVHGMDGFAGSIGISDSRGKASPVLNVLDSNQNKRYLMYYLRGMAYKDVFMALSTGIRVRSCDLRWNKLSVFPFLLPSLSEQSAIAAYLDSQCAKIDEIIAEAKASIEDYKRWKASIIYEAVTKGLDRDAEMKDSGIEWIGEIPAHWTTIANKYVMRKKKRICEKWKNQNVLSLTMNGVVVRDILNPVGKMPTTFDGYQFAYSGELLMCLFDIDVTPRCVGRVFCDGVTSPAYSCFQLNNHADLGYYYYYYLMVDNTKELLHLAKNLRHSFTEEQLGMLKVPFPPFKEQSTIAAYLDTQCAKIDELSAEKLSLIADLEAYKKSLIYEVVTGKRRVC